MPSTLATACGVRFREIMIMSATPIRHQQSTDPRTPGPIDSLSRWHPLAPSTHPSNTHTPSRHARYTTCDKPTTIILSYSSLLQYTARLLPGTVATVPTYLVIDELLSVISPERFQCEYNFS